MAIFKDRCYFMVLLSFSIFFYLTAFASDSFGSAASNDKIIADRTSAEIVSYPLQIKISRNTTFDFPLTIKNTESSLLIGMHLQTDSSWLIFNKSEFSIAPHESKKILVNLTVPQSVKADHYIINISLTGPVTDTVAFLVIVSEKDGISSMSRVDEEVVMLAIGDLKKRMASLSERGYDTTNPGKFVESAQTALRNGNVMESISYLDLAEESLDENVKKSDQTKTFLAIYVVVTLFAILFFQRYFKRKNRRVNKAESQSIFYV